MRLKKVKDLSILESERLVLKPLSKSFLSMEYVNWMNDPKVTRFIESGGNYTIKKLEIFLSETEKNPKYFWAIVIKKGDIHIGNIKIDPINFKHLHGEYGILIGNKKFWGFGYAKEASNLVIRYCFNDLNLKKIILGVNVKNRNAIMLYKNLGFVQEGRLKDHLNFEGKYVDLLRLSIFKSKSQK
tara:strand:- start:167 stop:721 length:555 start_codon:yes stop_codon:yes gene_type:complete